MSDTEYKTKALVGLSPIRPGLGQLAPNTTCRWSPLGALGRAQDTVPASSRRVIASWSLSGADEWAQPDGSVDPNIGGVSPQNYPTNTWRTLGSYVANVTPGCDLRAHVMFCPAGLVHKQVVGVWTSDGAWAEARVAATWRFSAATDGPNYHAITMPGSLLGTYGGAENTADGGNWASLQHRKIDGIRPTNFASSPPIGAAYSEWSTVTLELQVRGGARVVGFVVYEVPLAHVSNHDEAGLLSVHAMPAGPALTPVPMVKAPDGTSYEEHRHGTRRVAQVAARQSDRLGPRIMQWTAWDETTIDPLTDTGPDPVTVTSTSYVSLLNASITTYGTDDPGWVVAGAHAQLHRLCDPQLILRREASVVPVRVRVDASRSAGTGTVRVRCGLYEWVDVSVTGARDWYEATGYLESQVHADHDAAPLEVFALVASGTLSIYGISIDYGTW